MVDTGGESCYNLDHGGPIEVTVRDGRIIRVRPLILKPEDTASDWSLEVDGRVFSPPSKWATANFTLATKRRVYAENRVLYPMKRVDFDPEAPPDRRKAENRGKSEYERISWDEALDIIAREVKRIVDKYGPAAIAAECSSHQMWGYLNSTFGSFTRFFSFLGYTPVLHNSDSWEGWSWGATHAWGFYWRLGGPDQYDLLEDALRNTDMIVLWSADPETTMHTYSGHESSINRLWLKELGKQIVVIDPFCNYTAVKFADKWIAPKPGTDAALAAAIAYIWIKEGTYDEEYIETHTVGFDEFKKYVMGDEDGIPKTPEWAEGITEVPAREIRALAREWARKRTMLGGGNRTTMGGACRMAYAHEWTRMMVYLQSMQGLGKPGVNFWDTGGGKPLWEEFYFPGYAEGLMNIAADKMPVNPVKQMILRTLLPEAFLTNKKLYWRGFGFNPGSAEMQFTLNEYPLSPPDGARLRMLYRFGASYIGTMPESNRWVRMYRSPKLEFVVVQNPWFEGEAKFADLILPAATNLEREDLAEADNGGGVIPHGYNTVNHRVIVHMQRCIEPLGESKSDYDIFKMLAYKLGFGDDFTEGKTIDGWLKSMYEATDMVKVMPWEEFKKKGYYVVPVPKDRPKHRSFEFFYEKGRGLATPTGKIEFYSTTLARFDPNDEERPPVAHYIPSWETEDRERKERYPLILMTPHVKFSFHTQHGGDKNPWLDEIPHYRIRKGGRPWWPVRMNPIDAERRGIIDGDIVKVYNERGAVLGIAVLTKRVRPGVVHAYQACPGYDPIGEPGRSVDRGGCVNILTPNRFMSKNAHGFAPAHALVEVEKWEGPV